MGRGKEERKVVSQEVRKGMRRGKKEKFDTEGTVYSQFGDTLTCPFIDDPDTRTVTVPLAGTLYVFEEVLS